MGCGASSAAPAGLETDTWTERSLGAAGIGATGLSNAAESGALTGTAYAVSCTPGAAGEALLAVGQHLPWIAPVAFLIGAVVKAAHDAHTLKGDALKYAAFVRSVEAVLNEAALAGKLALAEAAVAQARAALEASLAHMLKLSCQKKMTALLVASRDKGRFAELQAELQRCTDLVGLAAAVSTDQMVGEQYEQAQKLAEVLASLGGLEAVGEDASKLAALEEAMAPSDALVMRRVAACAAQVSESGRRVEAALAAQFAGAGEKADLRHEVMAKQIDNLTTMLEAILRHKGLAASAASPGGGGGGDDAFEAAATGAGVHAAMEAMPARGDEASRIAKVRSLGLDLGDRAAVDALVGDERLEDLVGEALGGGDGGGHEIAWIGTLDNTHQVFLAGSTNGARGDASGLVMPREATQCQHTIASGEERFHSRLVDGQNETFDRVNLPALEQAGLWQPDAKSAPIIRGSRTLQSGAFDAAGAADTQLGSSTMTYGGLGAAFEALWAAPRATYAAVPIRLDGQTVATLCVVDRKERDKASIDYAHLETLASRAAAVFEEREPRVGQRGPRMQPAAEARPRGTDGADLVRLTVDDFAAVALDAGCDVAVLLHAAWCANCDALMLLWRALAAAQPAGASALVFATFDVTDADPPAEHACWRASHVPAVVLAPKGGSAPMAYDGGLEAGAVAAWLHQHVANFVQPPALAAAGAVERSAQRRPPPLASLPPADDAPPKPSASRLAGDGADTSLVALPTGSMWPPSAASASASELGQPMATGAHSEALLLLRASVASAAASGAQQLATLRRVGLATTHAGTFVRTAAVLLSAHAETYASTLAQIEECEEEHGGQLLGVAMGLQRDAAAQQLQLLQDLAGSSAGFADSDEFVALLEASALRASRVTTAHVTASLERAKQARLKVAANVVRAVL